MNIGEETEEERKTPLRVLDPGTIEVEEEPAGIPVEMPEQAPIAAPFWPQPSKVPVGGDYATH